MALSTVTIYRHSDGLAKMKEWKDPKKATPEELSPEGADIITYKELDPVLCFNIKRMTEKEIDNVLSNFIP